MRCVRVCWQIKDYSLEEWEIASGRNEVENWGCALFETKNSTHAAKA